MEDGVNMHILIAQDHSVGLVHHFYKLYQKNELCDVLLRTPDGATLGCHKIVLVACSEHFQTLISKGGTATKMQVILDVSAWCLRVLLEFMYTGQLIVKSGTELELLKVARHLRVDKVVELLKSTFDLSTPSPSPAKVIAKNIQNIFIKAEPASDGSRASDERGNLRRDFISPTLKAHSTSNECRFLEPPESSTQHENASVTETKQDVVHLSPSPVKVVFSPLKKIHQNVEEMRAAIKQLDFSTSAISEVKVNMGSRIQTEKGQSIESPRLQPSVQLKRIQPLRSTKVEQIPSASKLLIKDENTALLKVSESKSASSLDPCKQLVKESSDIASTKQDMKPTSLRGRRKSSQQIPRLTVTLEKPETSAEKCKQRGKKKGQSVIYVTLEEEPTDNNNKKDTIANIQTLAEDKPNEKQTQNLNQIQEKTGSDILNQVKKINCDTRFRNLSSLPLKKRGFDRLNSDEYAKNLELVRVDRKIENFGLGVPKEDASVENVVPDDDNDDFVDVCGFDLDIEKVPTEDKKEVKIVTVKPKNKRKKSKPKRSVEGVVKLQMSSVTAAVQQQKSGVTSSVQQQKSGVTCAVQQQRSGVTGAVKQQKSGVTGAVKQQKSGVTGAVKQQKSGVTGAVKQQKSGVGGFVKQKSGVRGFVKLRKSNVRGFVKLQKSSVRGLIRLKKSNSDDSIQCEKCGIHCKNTISLKQHFVFQHSPDPSAVYIARKILRQRIRENIVLKGYRKARRKKGSPHKCITCKVCKKTYQFYCTWHLHYNRQHVFKRRWSLQLALKKHFQWRKLVSRKIFPHVSIPEVKEHTDKPMKSNDMPSDHDSSIIVVYKCVICTLTFMTEEVLSQHVIKVHNLNLQSVHNQKENIRSTRGQKANVRSTLDQKEIRSMQDQKANLQPHDQKAKEQKDGPETSPKNAYHCRVCKLDLFSQSELNDHFDRVHGITTCKTRRSEMISCEVSGCDFCSRNVAIMSTHITREHPNIAYVCTVCGMTFSSKILIEKHITLKHILPVNDRNSCRLCGKTFARPVLLRQHEVSQHGIEHPDVKFQENGGMVKHPTRSTKNLSVLDSPRKSARKNAKVSAGTSWKVSAEKLPSVKAAKRSVKARKSTRKNVRKPKQKCQSSKQTNPPKSDNKSKKSKLQKSASACSKNATEHSIHDLSHASAATSNHIGKSDVIREQEQAVLFIQRENDSSNDSDISYIIEVVEEQPEYESVLTYVEEPGMVEQPIIVESSIESSSAASLTSSPTGDAISAVVCTPLYSLDDFQPAIQSTSSTSYTETTASAREAQVSAPPNSVVKESKPVVNHNVSAVKLKKSKPKPVYECGVCGYKTCVANVFTAHSKTHKKFSCDYCGKTFVAESKLKQHIHKRHPVEETSEDLNLLCAFCGESFPTQNLLDRHEKMHSIKTEVEEVDVVDYVDVKPPEVKLNKRFRKEGAFVCQTCNYRTLYLNNYRRHLRTHGSEKFQCPHCQKSYTEKEKLNKHIRIVHENNPLLCDTCGKAFLSYEGLKYHIEGHVNNRRPRQCAALDRYRTPTGFLCDVCGYKSKLSNNFKRHLTTHAEKISCKQCPSFFSDDKSLQHHIEQNHTNPFLCTYCGKFLKSQVLLSTHMRQHKKESNELGLIVSNVPQITSYMPDILKPKQEKETIVSHDTEYCCTICGYQTKKASQYMKHEKQHARGMLSCAKCDKQFLDAKILSRHFRMQHGRIFRCSLCPQILKTEKHLRKHIWKHENPDTVEELYHYCSQCPYKSNKSNNFKRHLRVHTGERFKCSLCGNIYSELFKLKNHIKFAHVQPLVCKLCGKSYTSGKGYRDHMSIKHGNPKKHKCQYCKKEFLYYYNYKNHLNTHEKSIFYRCGGCGRDFLWRNALMGHMKRCVEKASKK